MTQIVVQRGTQTLELEVDPPNWAGELFKVYQEEKMALLPANSIISIEHGTSGVEASKYPKSRYKLPNKLRISSARGTKILTL